MLRRAMYAPGAGEADADRYRSLAAVLAEPESGTEHGAEHGAASDSRAPIPEGPRRGRPARSVVLLVAAGLAGVVALVVGALATGRPVADPVPTPTLAGHVDAVTVPGSDGASSLAEAIAFGAPEATALAESLDRVLVVGRRAVRQSSALAVGPTVLALDDLDPRRTATSVTVVMHCGASNRYDWQLDGTHPGSTRTHIVATGSGRCDHDASAATVALAAGEAPARLATTVRASSAYVVDVIVGR